MNNPAQSGSQYFQTPIWNAQIPQEGPKAAAVNCSFTGSASSLLIDFTLTQTQQFMSYVQGVYIDNSANPASVSIASQNNVQLLTCPPKTQGYFPLVASKPTKFVASTTGAAGGGTVQVGLTFYNVPIPAIYWNASGGGGNYSSAFSSGQFTSGGSAAELIAPNSARKGLVITNVGATTVYLGSNSGVTTGTGGGLLSGDSFNIDAGNLYLGAIYAIGAGTLSYMEFS
jgi:hypothetical protein